MTYLCRFTVCGRKWTYSFLVSGALSHFPSLSGTPTCCILLFRVDMPFSFTSLQTKHINIWVMIMEIYDISFISSRLFQTLTPFHLLLPAFWFLELSAQRASRQCTWAGRSGFCSSRWHRQQWIPPERWSWRCQPQRLWSCRSWLVGERKKSQCANRKH